MDKQCLSCGATKRHHARGLCHPCYKRRWKHQDFGKADLWKNEIAPLAEAEAAYVAGLIDGEGSICIIKPDDGFRLQISVEMSDRATIEWLAQKFGMVYKVRPYARQRNPKHKIQYTTYIHGAKAQNLLGQIRPYMITKRNQAEIALAFPAGHVGRTPTPQMLNARIALNRMIREENSGSQ